MSRRNNNIATQAETADLVSALSEAASSSSSSAPTIHATRGTSAALLAKEIIHDSQPVATSSTGLRFRSFSPIIALQSLVPQVGSSVFLTEDDLPPSNQIEVPQIVVADTMLLSPSGAMRLPEVMLPLSTMQVTTAYSLIRTLRTFCCENPGVLDTTSALVQLPPVGDALSLDGDLRYEQEEYAQNVYVYHLVNAAMS